MNGWMDWLIKHIPERGCDALLGTQFVIGRVGMLSSPRNTDWTDGWTVGSAQLLRLCGTYHQYIDRSGKQKVAPENWANNYLLIRNLARVIN